MKKRFNRKCIQKKKLKKKIRIPVSLQKRKPEIYGTEIGVRNVIKTKPLQFEQFFDITNV